MFFILIFFIFSYATDDIKGMVFWLWAFVVMPYAMSGFEYEKRSH